MQLPACHPSEPDFGTDVPVTAEVPTPRGLYHALLRVEENPHYLLPAYRFAHAALEGVSIDSSLISILPGKVPDIVEAVSNDRDLDGIQAGSVSPRQRAQVIREFAPYALIDGCWLQGVVSLPTSETPAGALLLAQFMERIGAGKNRLYLGERYRSLLRASDNPDWRGEDECFSTSPRISDASFEFALLPLAIGLFPQIFFAEIVGLNLWCACVGPSRVLNALQCDPAESKGDAGYFQRSTCDLAAPAAQTVAALLTDAIDRASMAARVARGYAAASHGWRRWERAVLRNALQSPPRAEMLRLIERKAPYAAGYHSRVRLGEKCLDEYFRSGPQGHASLLDALSASRFIAAGSPQDSPLLSQVSAFGGPMFEIFSVEERQIIGDWIRSLALPETGVDAGVDAQTAGFALCGHYTAPQDLAAFESQSIARFQNIPAGEQTYYLLNIDLFPIARPYSRTLAARGCEQLSRVCALHPMRDLRPLRPREMPQFLDTLHREQLATYDPEKGRALSRDAVVSSTLSGAAGMLTDGGWLQGFSDIARVGQEEYRNLFAIYASELGDGRLEWNHNILSRRLLASMGFDLPATHEPAFFRAHPGVIRHEAGLTGLAMAINHRMMLPELLGINLATEAWGVGNSFREAADGLQALGYDPTISVIHNSIDNFSTGHTRQSMQAVQSALDRVARIDPKTAENWWERIWTAFFGHRALIDFGDPGQQLEEARLYFQRLDFEAAERSLRQIVDRGEPAANALLRGFHADAWHLLGVIALRRSDTRSAIEQFGRALGIAPARTAASLDLSFALMASGQPQEALAVLERAQALAPDDAGILCARGNALKDLDRLAEALASFELALARQPDFAPAHYNRGEALRRLGRPQEALQCYEQALTLGCPVQHGQTGRAMALLSLGRREDALDACDRALELSPQSVSLQELRRLILKNERLRSAQFV